MQQIMTLPYKQPLPIIMVILKTCDAVLSSCLPLQGYGVLSKLTIVINFSL